MKDARTQQTGSLFRHRHAARIHAAALLFAALFSVRLQAQTRLLNAADMEHGQTEEDCGQAVIGADFETGTFHKAQDAATKTGIFFSADGSGRVGIFRLKGDFTFRQSFENDVRFASTFNPLRTMPYVIADSTGGNWQKQDYSMWADISAPIVKDRLGAGLGIDLEVGRGAKKVDPRPQAGMCRIELKPSLSFNCPGLFSVSAGFIYGLYRETANLILYDSSQPQKLYLLKGLGQYTYEVFSSTERERKYDGNTLGGSFDLRRTDRYGTVSLYGEYRNGLEKVFDIDYSKPHDRGRYYTHDFRTGIDADFSMTGKKRFGAAAMLEYSGLRHSGREFVQHFDSSPEVNAWVTDSELPGRYTDSEDHLRGKAEFFINRAGTFGRSWVLTAEIEGNRSLQEYRATGAKETIKNIRAAAGVRKYMSTRTGALDLKADVRISRGLGSHLDYTPRETEDTHIAVDLIDHDFALPSNWHFIDLGAGYGWNLSHGRQLRIDASAFFKSSERTSLSLGENGLELNSAPGRWWRSGCSLSIGFRF